MHTYIHTYIYTYIHTYIRVHAVGKTSADDMEIVSLEAEKDGGFLSDEEGTKYPFWYVCVYVCMYDCELRSRGRRRIPV